MSTVKNIAIVLTMPVWVTVMAMLAIPVVFMSPDRRVGSGGIVFGLALVFVLLASGFSALVAIPLTGFGVPWIVGSVGTYLFVFYSFMFMSWYTSDKC